MRGLECRAGNLAVEAGAGLRGHPLEADVKRQKLPPFPRTGNSLISCTSSPPPSPIPSDSTPGLFVVRVDYGKGQTLGLGDVQIDFVASGSSDYLSPFPPVENWVPREDDGAVVPSYYDEETETLMPLPRDVWPEHLHWDLDLKQGEVLDPHWGRYGPDAPYGYHDGTGEPREEPLYDSNGYPIVPREPLRSRHGNSAEDYQSDEDWRQRSEDALDRWGRWGQKRKWMQKHAGLGEADWQEYARKKWGDGE